MKAIPFSCSRRVGRHWLAALGCLALAGLVWPPGLQATQLQTLGGGPTSSNPNAYGFADGNTLNLAQFHGPAGIAFDAAGTGLYVADCTNNAIRFISSVGNSSASFTSTFARATNGINRPVALAVDGAGYVYVLNRGSGSDGSVIKFNGAQYSSFGIAYVVSTNASCLVGATSLALDGLTNLYVVVKGNTVIRLTPSGQNKTVGVISESGVSLRGIAVLGNGLLALTDAGKHGIWILNPLTGVASKLTGFHGAADVDGPATMAAFNKPEMIAKAGGGILVVADRGNQKVKIVDASGNVARLFGVSPSKWYTGPGANPGWWDGDVCTTDLVGCPESREPVGVAVGSDGSVYDTEVYYHLVRRATSTGLTGPGAPGQMPLFNGVMGLAADTVNNRLYIADKTNNAVQMLNLNNNLTTTFADGSSGLKRPVAVSVDASNNVYVLNQGTNADGSILQFDLYGNWIATRASGLASPTALAVDGAGNLFVTDTGGKVRVFGAGMSNVLATITNAGVQLQGLAFFDDGTLALSDAGNHVLWRLNPMTRAITLLSGSLGLSGTSLGASNYARFNRPQQLARTGSGVLVVADYGNNRLVTVDRYGSATAVLDSANSMMWFGRSGDPHTSTSSRFVPMATPVGVAVGNNGLVYVSEVTNSAVRGLLATGMTAPSTGPYGVLPLFNTPMGIALNSAGTSLFVADRTNNVIQVLDLGDNLTSTFLTASDGVDGPVDLALDGEDNLYVLNQRKGTNGCVFKFDRFGNRVATNAIGLVWPTALTLDSSANLFVTEQGGRVQRFTAAGSNLVFSVTNAGVQLKGIAVFDDGAIAVSDAGNHVIWQIEPVSKLVSLLTGVPGLPGANLGSVGYAKMNQPQHLERAANNVLIAADGGNNRLVVVDRSGSITNILNSTNALVWFGVTGDPCGSASARFVPMVSPLSVALGNDGGVYASEILYNDIRKVLGTGLVQAGGGGGSSGGGSNIVVLPPTISPTTGYYPMGQIIRVSSTISNVCFTTDGSEPTANSLRVEMDGYVGFIRWFSPTNDLTGLRVKAFVGTNSSASVGGGSALVNSIGVPTAPTADGSIYAGIGSTIVVPVVINLQSNVQVRSYQFRVEIAPIGASPPITQEFQTLAISTNDYLPLVTAYEGNSTLSIPGQPYSFFNTRGLAISTANGGTFYFKKYAVVSLLQIHIPDTATEGNSYSLSVSYPSATSDGLNTPVPLTPMSSATILVTNVPYLVGDSASAYGGWYNAGGFGDTNLDNADVNQAFYAAVGLRVPYSFSDVYNAMDADWPDMDGFVGGDTQIRYGDWQVILQRSLGLDTNRWARVWTSHGLDHPAGDPFHRSFLKDPFSRTSLDTPWYREVLLGAVSVGHAAPAALIKVPVYAKLADGATLSGMQFRAVVTPISNAPPVTQAPQFIPAEGVPSPTFQKSFRVADKAFGWPLQSFNFQSRSSNFLGYVAFMVPGAWSGEQYRVSFANADGSPDLNTAYTFETRSATVTVNAPANPASVCSDEWRLHFFGSLTDPLAGDLVDSDGDGMPNAQEFLAGTDPTDARAKLCFTGAEKPKGQSHIVLHWLTAPGRVYEVQWSTSLAGGTWTTLSTLSGDGSVADCVDSNPTGLVRYYRLRTLP